MRYVAAVLLIVGLLGLMGQTKPAATATAPVPLKPDVADAKYGPHERNAFDLYLATSDKPTPVVVYIHGGGFIGGDKKTINGPMLRQLRAAGISVAAVNYRYSTIAPAPAPFADCARAIQFLRSKSAEWNIDKTRIAATGISAGAGISLWLAFHDDMVDAKSDDAVLRESTRLACAYVQNAQTSYDARWIKEHIPGNAWQHYSMPTLFDVKPEEILEPSAEKAKLMTEFSPIELVKKGCPPVYMTYAFDRSEPEGKDPSAAFHHPKFGDLLKEKMDKLGVECVVKVKGDAVEGEGPVEFLERQLGVRSGG